MYFLTFANRGWGSTWRIEKEAKKFGFDQIFAWNEFDLDEIFWKKHKHFIKNNTRGFGYWIWKPQVILQALEKIPKGSCLIYADTGCKLNVKGKKRLYEYEKLAREHKGLNILTFGLISDVEIVSMYTKMDTYNLIGGNKKLFVTASVIVVINTNSVKNFIKKWLDLCTRENYHYVDDSISVSPNSPCFIDHRHDQSILALLSSAHNAKMIHDETYSYHDETYSYQVPILTSRISPSYRYLILFNLKNNNFKEVISISRRKIVDILKLVIRRFIKVWKVQK